MNKELLVILDSIERDKGIDREVLIQAVEAALASAARKSLGAEEEDEVAVIIDREDGQMSVQKNGSEVNSVGFSRIAAQTAKQVIIQKIREAERDVVFTEFQGRVGDIVTGTVHRFERGDVIVELGRAEAILRKSERIPREEYQQGDRIQGYVLDVQKTAKGPSIILSRIHEGFIVGLFTLEVPEIAEGIVEVKGIAREAGDRTKIAVSSSDDKVDCVGACVGMRGTRVKNIVRELHGEKIDIIRWQESMQEFIAAALAPAKITQILETKKVKHALVIVEDDQLSLAIGKRGQNVRLASKLTGWDLEIKSVNHFAKELERFGGLNGMTPELEKQLADVGVHTLERLVSISDEFTKEWLADVPAETLSTLAESAQKALDEIREIEANEASAQSSAQATAEAEAPAAEEATEQDAGETEEAQAEAAEEPKAEEPAAVAEEVAEPGEAAEESADETESDTEEKP